MTPNKPANNQRSFSAHSLQAYVDCARRYELSYLEELKWPAVESEPLLQSERHMVDGRRFHEMVHRDVLGVEVPLPDSAKDPDISRWWNNYMVQRPANVDGKRFAEKTLVGSVATMEVTMVATCDLIVISEGESGRRARIFDWKTWRRRHTREWLLDRLQTRIYPYLLVQSSATLAGGKPLTPDEVEMVYWYSDFPDNPEVFAYSETQFREDEAYLGGLVDEILNREPGSFQLTTDEKKCMFCVYRSFCDRGGVAGYLEDGDLEAEAEVPSQLGDLDDYEAIAF